MEKQATTSFEKNMPKRGESHKRATGGQAFSMEVMALLDVFARIELRRREKQHAAKEVS